MAALTEQRRELVHEPTGHARRADFGVERDASELAPIEHEAGSVAQRERERDRQRAARRQARARGHGGRDHKVRPRGAATAIGERSDDTRGEPAPGGLDRRGVDTAARGDVDEPVELP